MPFPDVNCSAQFFVIFSSDCWFSHNNWELKAPERFLLQFILFLSVAIKYEWSWQVSGIMFDLDLKSILLLYSSFWLKRWRSWDRIFSCSPLLLGNQQTNSFIMYMDIEAVTCGLRCFEVVFPFNLFKMTFRGCFLFVTAYDISMNNRIIIWTAF